MGWAEQWEIGSVYERCGMSGHGSGVGCGVVDFFFFFFYTLGNSSRAEKK